jgi:hypothetical protein
MKAAMDRLVLEMNNGRQVLVCYATRIKMAVSLTLRYAQRAHARSLSCSCPIYIHAKCNLRVVLNISLPHSPHSLDP